MSNNAGPELKDLKREKGKLSEENDLSTKQENNYLSL